MQANHHLHTSSKLPYFLGQLGLPLEDEASFPAPAPSRQHAIAVAERTSKSALSDISIISKDLLGSSLQAQILRSRRAQDGRIVISGRMRDVCAELDRLCDEPS